VDARVEVQLGVIVAVAAMDFPKDLFMREVLDVGVFVAIDTLELAVDRPEKDRLIDKEGDRLAASAGVEIFIRMAVEARLVILT
jgi:hypothetical protein